MLLWHKGMCDATVPATIPATANRYCRQERCDGQSLDGLCHGTVLVMMNLTRICVSVVSLLPVLLTFFVCRSNQSLGFVLTDYVRQGEKDLLSPFCFVSLRFSESAS